MVGDGKVSVKVNGVDKEFRTGLLTFEARLTLAKLRQTFDTTLILHHFDPKYNILIKTDV